MDPFRDDKELIAELHALRPEPSQEFTAELDGRAAAGFPRRSSRVRSTLGRLATRLQPVRPHHALVPAGVTALAAVAAVTVVVAINGRDTGSTPSGETHFSALSPGAQGSEPNPSEPGKFSDSHIRSHAAGSERVLTPFSAASATQLSAPPSAFGNGNAVYHNGSGAYGSPNRLIERSSEIVLGSDPAEVRKDAGEVFEAVHAHRGIVLNSSVRDGAEGEAGARFDLLIPSAKVGDALAAFSAIAEVRSRHEATVDITAPTVRAGELLEDSRAKIDGLLAQLSDADAETERAVAEAELRAERRHNARLRSQLSTLQRRASFSRVSLQIETGGASTSSGGGGWGIGDALGDAGHILAIAAGVAIVGLAVVGPLALIALLAWLANRARIRRARERAFA